MSRWYSDYESSAMREMQKALDGHSNFSELIESASATRYLCDSTLATVADDYLEQSSAAVKAAKALEYGRTLYERVIPKSPFADLKLSSVLEGARVTRVSGMPTLLEDVRKPLDALMQACQPEAFCALAAYESLLREQQAMLRRVGSSAMAEAQACALAVKEAYAFSQRWWEQIARTVTSQWSELDDRLRFVQRPYLRSLRYARVKTRKRRRNQARQIRLLATSLVNDLLQRYAERDLESVPVADINEQHRLAAFARILLGGLAAQVAPLHSELCRNIPQALVVARQTQILISLAPHDSQALQQAVEPFCQALEILEALRGPTRVGAEALTRDDLLRITAAVDAFLVSLKDWIRRRR